MVKVHIYNTRLTEGGAADVALNLHNLLLETKNFSPTYYYGYSFKGGKSYLDNGRKDFVKMTPNYIALLNRFFHSIVGQDIINPVKKRFHLNKLAANEIVHLHNIHHHIFNSISFLNHLQKTNKKFVWTLHDDWVISKKWPPLPFLPLQDSVFKKKFEIIEKVLPYCVFISPSKHLSKRVKKIYPKADIRIIKNSINLDRTDGKSKEIIFPGEQKPIILIIANNLADKEKCNHDFINNLVSKSIANVVTIGLNSPFTRNGFINLGHIKEKDKIYKIANCCDAMLFSSIAKYENDPLVIKEAHHCGLPVLATPTNASNESMQILNGKTLSENEIINKIKAKEFFSHYQEISSKQQLRKLADQMYSVNLFLSQHIGLYEEILNE